MHYEADTVHKGVCTPLQNFGTCSKAWDRGFTIQNSLGADVSWICIVINLVSNVEKSCMIHH